ncbi:MAG: hypothetical protein MAG795_01123 [Candidatus Woesearchaeota archaeon]|nr:hypothetical protein [Candidatus Woesearchaeota archaeon]
MEIKKQVMGIISLFLGLASIPLSFRLIGPPIAVIGVVFSILQQRKLESKYASIGLILNLVGILLFWLVWILSLTVAPKFI